jgi:hypothetical protein
MRGRSKRSTIGSQKSPLNLRRSRKQIPARDGKRNGHGVLTYANGERYDGELRDDKPTNWVPYLLQFSGYRNMACALARPVNAFVTASDEPG